MGAVEGKEFNCSKTVAKFARILIKVRLLVWYLFIFIDFEKRFLSSIGNARLGH